MSVGRLQDCIGCNSLAVIMGAGWPDGSGITVTKDQLEAFTNYLNTFGVNEFSRSDAEVFLNMYDSDAAFKKDWMVKPSGAIRRAYHGMRSQ